MMHVKRTKQTNCPACHHELSAVSDLHGHTPQPGDISICASCTELLIFTDTMDFRLMTEDEFNELPEDATKAELRMLLKVIRIIGPPRCK